MGHAAAARPLKPSFLLLFSQSEVDIRLLGLLLTHEYHESDQGIHVQSIVPTIT